MISDRLTRFEKILADLPVPARSLLADLPEQGGKLDHNTCLALTSHLNMSWEQLMLRLLPLAGIFAQVPISGFAVGAVVLTESRSASIERELYLGANLEFEGQTLNATIHAEQSAAVNAWHQGGGRLLAVATSETPCGHCRQFLHEFYGGKNLFVIQTGHQVDEYRIEPIAKLLPQAFTPTDLDKPITLMAPKQSVRLLKLKDKSDDPLVASALKAATLAYAPYTGNLAGCALKILNGRTVSGCSLESVAFNPSVSALHAAVIRMNLMTLSKSQVVERAVFVERPTKICQQESVQMLMKTVMPDIMLEYHLAQEEKE